MSVVCAPAASVAQDFGLGPLDLENAWTVPSLVPIGPLPPGGAGPGSFGSTSAYEAIGREAEFWRRAPDSLLAPDVGLLLGGLDMDRDRDWAGLAKARNLAVAKSALDFARGRALPSIEYLPPGAVRESLPGLPGGGPGLFPPASPFATQEAFPLAVDGRTVTRIRTGEYDLFTVGGDRVDDLPGWILALWGGLGPGIIQGVGQGTTEIRFGDPVPDVPGSAFPPSGSSPQVPAPAIGPDGAQSCGTPDDLSRCYLPAVALHGGAIQYCSGVLVSATEVLTAAHCACWPRITQVTVGNTIRPGAVGAVRQTVSIADRVDFLKPGICEKLAEKPNETASYADGDLAILHLTRPIAGASALFALVGDPRLLGALDLVEVAGFGRREASPGGEKYVVSLAIATRDCTVAVAAEISVTEFDCIRGRELVAIDPGLRKDTCHGDSGAGVFVRLKSGRLAVIAVTSRGVNGDCGPGGKYALVTLDDVRDWLVANSPGVGFAEGEEPAQVLINMAGGERVDAPNL